MPLLNGYHPNSLRHAPSNCELKRLLCSTLWSYYQQQKYLTLCIMAEFAKRADPYRSWGRYPPASHTQVLSATWRDDPIPPAALTDSSCLCFGNGRSYGDSCLNDGGALIDTRGLDHFINFSPEDGVLECEAGLLLRDIIKTVLPQGWFLPVSPGTQFVTLGGAIANDVHGKNHHRAGSMGHHIQTLQLLRSDGSRLSCSLSENRDLFRATIGGMGLTGLITHAKLQLKPVAGPYIDQELTPFSNIDEFFAIVEETDAQFEHTVAWIDCAAKGKQLGRGIMIGGNHSKDTQENGTPSRDRFLTLPFTPPFSMVNGFSLKLFNEFYYRMQRRKSGRSRIHYRPFFYPLDNILLWNRMYGPKGFFQYQCAVPIDLGKDAVRDMLTQIERRGAGSFLAVLKQFGNHPPAGLLSFAREGYTLSLDFPNRGPQTLELLKSLDLITSKAGGAVYPAKDARMSAESFQKYYPNWSEFAAYKDPAFSSSFWRRVTESNA